MNKSLLLLLITFLSFTKLQAQWTNPVQLNNMNEWSYNSGFIHWYSHSNNTPTSQGYGNGLQLVLGTDSRFGAQIVVPTFDQNIYFRRYCNGYWYNWDKIWHSGNFNKKDVDITAKNILLHGGLKDLGSLNYQTSVICFNSTNGSNDWESGFIAGTVGNPGDISGYPGGLSFSTKAKDGSYISTSIERMRISYNGNVGIGTTSPKNLLDVNGTIHAREVKVDLTGWSDFVFHPSYKLKPLMEVEQFIKTNGHLQDIPSAAEVEQNGVNVGEMLKKLLQKVEELTLYVIELKKENEQLKQENAKNVEALKVEIEKIKK